MPLFLKGSLKIYAALQSLKHDVPLVQSVLNISAEGRAACASLQSCLPGLGASCCCGAGFVFGCCALLCSALLCSAPLVAAVWGSELCVPSHSSGSEAAKQTLVSGRCVSHRASLRTADRRRDSKDLHGFFVLEPFLCLNERDGAIKSRERQQGCACSPPLSPPLSLIFSPGLMLVGRMWLLAHAALATASAGAGSCQDFILC